MFAEIIAVGSEMLTPHRQDTNSLYLTSGLNDLGITVAFKTIVGDNRQHLCSAICTALSRVDVLLLSGGLGPTEDDLTRECVAEVLQVRLLSNGSVLESLRQRFAARKMAMPPNNAKQADMLEGAALLPNANGSAPGQWLEITRDNAHKIIILLPGPPKELKPLFDAECKPRLARAFAPAHLARGMLRMALIPESQVDARTAPIYQQCTDVETTILAGHAEIQLHFLCTRPTMKEAQARIDEVVHLVAGEMRDDIFSSNGDSLEEVVVHALIEREFTLSVAESCTGGWLGERLTSVPNSSQAFVGGAIVYSNNAKTVLTDVPVDLLEAHGAVCEPVARALAEGIRRRTGTDLAIGITGIAGPVVPLGPDADKPIGLVYIALAGAKGTLVKQVNVAGDRERIRLWATQHALEMIRRHFL